MKKLTISLLIGLSLVCVLLAIALAFALVPKADYDKMSAENNALEQKLKETTFDPAHPVTAADFTILKRDIGSHDEGHYEVLAMKDADTVYKKYLQNLIYSLLYGGLTPQLFLHSKQIDIMNDKTEHREFVSDECDFYKDFLILTETLGFGPPAETRMFNIIVDLTSLKLISFGSIFKPNSEFVIQKKVLAVLKKNYPWKNFNGLSPENIGTNNIKLSKEGVDFYWDDGRSGAHAILPYQELMPYLTPLGREIAQ